MSGPVSAADVPAGTTDDPSNDPNPGDIEVLEGRSAEVGGFGVRRVLPRRVRRTVGAWCFVDHIGPGEVTDHRGLDIGPHPHIGLQTVTWLLEGEVVHYDSLGSEQVIRPGQLNLMTAGHGVSHSEETAGTYRGVVHGVQLWVAQPDSTRDGDPAFEHHAELPHIDTGNGDATVIVGAFGGPQSPARRDTDHVAVDFNLRPGRTTVPVDAEFEHAVVVLDGALAIGGRQLQPGQLGYVAIGRDEIPLDVDGPCRALLIGGRPWPEPLLMWWNYVARTRDEVTIAHRDWIAGDDRFGRVASPLARVVTSGPPWAAEDTPQPPGG